MDPEKISAALHETPRFFAEGWRWEADSGRSFVIVIVGGLVAALILGVYLLPTLYVWVAGDGDVLAGRGIARSIDERRLWDRGTSGLVNPPPDIL